MNNVICIGDLFERWRVISSAPDAGENMWWCECICPDGTKSLRSGRNLRRKHGKSCGCLRREAVAARAKQPRPPAISTTPEYRAWKGMWRRCNDPQNNKFKYYGARGIRMCKQWDCSRGIDTFWRFLADVGPRPGQGYVLDRIDNDGDYEPGNCHWAPYTPQSRNRRCVRKITYAGGTISTVELAEELAEATGLNPKLLRSRLNRGMTIEEAISRPKGAHSMLACPKCHRPMNPGYLTLHLPTCGLNRRRHRRKARAADASTLAPQPEKPK
jgi:hypothetical protein